jgi:hypothetical protein
MKLVKKWSFMKDHTIAVKLLLPVVIYCGNAGDID